MVRPRKLPVEIPQHFHGERKPFVEYTTGRAFRPYHVILRGRHMNHKHIAAAAIALSLVAAACGSSSSGSSSGGSSSGSLMNGEIKCSNQYKGKEVHIFSPVRDSENDKPVDDLVAAYQPLVDCTGVKIVWEEIGRAHV